MTPNPTPTEGVEDFDSARNTRETSAATGARSPAAPDQPLAERIARALFADEWRDAPGNHPDFDAENPAYWIGQGCAAIAASEATILSLVKWAYEAGWSHGLAKSRLIVTDDGLIDGAKIISRAVRDALAAAREHSSPRQVPQPIREDL